MRYRMTSECKLFTTHPSCRHVNFKIHTIVVACNNAEKLYSLFVAGLKLNSHYLHGFKVEDVLCIIFVYVLCRKRNDLQITVIITEHKLT